MIRDCAYRGIALQRENPNENGRFDCTEVLGNVIENSVETKEYHHQIYIDELNESIVSGNRCVGYDRAGSEQDRWGINLQNGPQSNLIVNNVVTGQSVGIAFTGHNSGLMGNIVKNCSTGITLSHCIRSNYMGNIIYAETPENSRDGLFADL